MSILPKCIYCGAIEGWSHEPTCQRETIIRERNEAFALRSQLEAMQAEIDRLQGGLQSILDFKPDAEHVAEPHTQIALFAKQTARAALSGEKL